jgi:hypothetical protein
MKVFERFPFLLGLLASLFFLLSFKVKSPNSSYNSELALMSICAGIVYWVWIVLKIRADVKRQNNKNAHWLYIAIAAPFFGALLYQITQERVMIEQEQPQQPANEMAA